MSESSGPRRRPTWLIAGAVVLLALLAAAALRRPGGPVVPTARAARKDLTVSVATDGTLEPPAGGELRASEAATVAAILAREGERVTGGTVLVRLSSPELEEAALDARSKALTVEEERARAAADLEVARREAAHRREIVESDARLLEQKAIAKATSESDALALKEAEDRVRQGEARVASLSGHGRGRVELTA